MSKKNKKQAKSGLPSGDITPTKGSNYMMDGYDFDFQYGDGVLDAATHPSVHGISELPEDVIGKQTSSELPQGVQLNKVGGIQWGEDDETGFEYDDIMASNVTDLSWLEVDRQDYERLPRNPVDTMIPELVEAWSLNRDKSNFRLQSNTQDLEAARYHKEAEDTQVRTARLSKVEKKRILRMALRQASAGVPLREVIANAEMQAGDRAKDLRSIIAHLKREHGLLGNVYLESQAYTKCATGKWSEQVRKKASTSRYIIASDKCNGCIMAKQGNCSVFNKKLVPAVDWDEAKKKYAGRFTSLNIKVANTGDAKADLKKAFKSNSKSTRRDTDFHIQPHLADSVSPEKAMDKLASLPQRIRKVIASNIEANKKKQKVVQALNKYKTAGLITEKQHGRLMASTANPDVILRTTATFIALNKKASTYKTLDGSITGEARSIWNTLAMSEKEARKATAKLNAHLKNSLENDISRLVKAHLLTQREATIILSMEADAEKKMKVASALIQKKSREKTKISSTPKKVSNYQGEGEGAIHISNTPVDKTMQELEKNANRNYTENKTRTAIAKYAKELVHSGWSGNILGDLIQEKFGSEAFMANESIVRKIEEEGAMRKSSNSSAAPIFNELSEYDMGGSYSELDNISFNKEADQESTLDIAFGGFDIL